MVEVAGGVVEEAVGSEVFLGGEELVRSIEPIDLVCALCDRI
jgi:hypothetical protein